MNEFLEGNRELWDEWTEIHESSEFYGLEEFRAGGIRLRDYELEQVGDVHGKSLLHLQCHFGIDTLSWARLGATVTGADFSPKAIDLARRLAVGSRPAMRGSSSRTSTTSRSGWRERSTSCTRRAGCWAGSPTSAAGRASSHTS